MTQKQSVLGKGLASLLPGAMSVTPPPPPPAVHDSLNSGADKNKTTDSENQKTEATSGFEVPSSERIPGITHVSLSEIRANQYQPRREFSPSELKDLAESIKVHGIIQPLVVRKDKKGYELIAGERRFRAAKMCDLKQVPVVVRKSTDRESLEMALIENIQRENLNCIDEALAYFQLLQEFSLTQEEAAKRVGKDRVTITNTLRLLKLPQEMMDALKSGKLSRGHGKVLVGIEDTGMRSQLFEEIKNQNFSVRAAEDRAAEMKALLEAKNEKNTSSSGGVEAAEGSPKAEKSRIASRLKNLGYDLTKDWSAKVEIKGNGRKGKILIHYGTREELDRIVSAMQNKAIWQAPPTSPSP